MQCERSGRYKPPKTRKKPNLEGISSRKCNCPFRLKSFFDKNTNDWWLAMICGMHNHDLDEKLSGHLIAEEKKKVIDMTKSLTVPRNILTNLKQNNKENVTTIKQVYNVRTRWRKGERGNMTELQYLISKLVEHKYVYYTSCNSEETTLEDIFFAHPESIKLLNTFSTVLVMDSTYKTNNYQMLLFEIVGCSSTKMTYSIGLTFLHFELEDNFTLALTMVKGLLSSKDNMPKVIVTKRDGTFDECRWHIFP
ncbi:protein FAR1-RELATED SEQUENCE 5-like [Medicago truncatula]|uniref:protein FAR1-RELATED SEQUENCE 5-like n=1 Tax=Medicago truncatula TaxID=3880 RepID=UPI000D2F393A|nr:protein FAR1-RELATED SEQUENCE 5-like [Medicago truncatula]